MLIEIQGVSKYFQFPSRAKREKVAAVNNVSLAVGEGKMLALVGSSGSGKTTLLRCIAGLESPDEGTIRIAGQDVFSSANAVDVPTERRNLGFIFQSYALWPNMTVEGNVAYPLQRRRFSDADCKARVQKYLSIVSCDHLASRYPHELSGGQQQRVALARALVYEPSVMLFDEPLSNLDATLREQLRSSIRSIQRQLGITGVYVTHDQSEAFYLGDQVAILSHGELIQVGRPDDIYSQPNRPEVAKFMGAVNRSAGSLCDGGSAFHSSDLGKVELTETQTLAGNSGRPTLLFIRPENVRLRPVSGAGPVVTVVDRATTGAFEEYVVELSSGANWRTRGGEKRWQFDLGDKVELVVASEEAFLFHDADHAARVDGS